MLVSNTSTLVLLVKIGCLEEFIEIAPVIEIPSDVKREALFEKESYYAKLIEKFIDEKKIKVVVVRDKIIQQVMAEFRLDKGEAAAYAMFNNKRHKAVMTDDGELIKLCKLENIPFICAMAIVIRLYEKKIISKEKSIGKLEELYKIGRYSKNLYEHFKSEVK